MRLSVTEKEIPAITFDTDGNPHPYAVEAKGTTIWRRLFWLIKFPWFVIEFIIKGRAKL